MPPKPQPRLGIYAFDEEAQIALGGVSVEVLDAADAEGLTDRDALYTMLSYFDVKNFAPKVTCPAYMSFGLQDPTCPPHTNFSIYNNLGSSDKHWFCVPTCGHAMWQEPSWSAERDAFLSRF
jgi:cephalosporin-C deacetylase-like acetyl esterase